MTDEAKHAQGPWKWEPVNRLARHVRGPSGQLIADVGGYDGLRYPDEVTGDEGDANARLIAAAPELLDACENAENALRILALHPKGVDIEAVREDLTAVLAKATKAQPALAAECEHPEEHRQWLSVCCDSGYLYFHIDNTEDGVCAKCRKKVGFELVCELCGATVQHEEVS